jgi:hypothetical protein
MSVCRVCSYAFCLAAVTFFVLALAKANTTFLDSGFIFLSASFFFEIFHKLNKMEKSLDILLEKSAEDNDCGYRHTSNEKSLTKSMTSGKMEKDLENIRRERDKIFCDWIHTDEEAKEKMIRFYNLIKDFDFPPKKYDGSLEYSNYIYHLGFMKKSLTDKEYINAACELRDERYISLQYPGAKANIMYMIETELLNDVQKA